MAKYLIHAVPRRMWYVNDYLIPSLIDQGILDKDISVYNDENHDGNLVSCLKSFLTCEDDGGTWHLQDDVCACRDFKERTEKYDHGLVCGFSSELYDGPGNTGEVDRKDMWFSFPCIRIPNEYARESAIWINEYIIGNPIYQRYWENGVNDDWAFRLWLKEFHKDDRAINLAPNLVDHVDYLVGGGTGKKFREKPVRAQYWEDFDIIADLEQKIKKNA